MASNGKNDMERIGLFSEMGYISLGDRYPKVDPKSRGFNEAAGKGKQMLPGGSKTRAGTQAGYFDSGYKRVLEGEAYTDPIKMRRAERIKNMKKNIVSKAWLPSNFTKKKSGNGSNYGTFSGAHKSFAPNKVAGKAYVTPGRNFTTTPGKKGTGYGYVNVTFQKYQEHSVEPYNRSKELRRQNMEDHKKNTKGSPFKLNLHPKTFFDQNPYRSDKPIKAAKSVTATQPKLVVKTPFRPSNPGKQIAGCKAGTFEQYPNHSVDLYLGKNPIMFARSSKSGKHGIFHPSPGPKSTPTKSTLDQNVTRSMNRNNYKTVKTVMSF